MLHIIIKKTLLTIFFSVFVFAQGQTWERTYPEYWSKFGNMSPDVITQLKDNHFVFARSALVNVEKETYLIKINRDNGDVIFEKKITFSLFSVESPRDIMETDSKNIIVVGISGIDHAKAWLVVTDSLGNILIQKTFLPTGNYINGVLTRVYKVNNNYLATGGATIADPYSKSHWLVEFNENLEIISERFLNLDMDVYTFEFDQEDSCFFAYGCEQYASYFDLRIMKLNKNWEKIWDKTYHQNQVDKIRPTNIQAGKNHYYLNGQNKDRIASVIVIDKEDGSLAEIKSLTDIRPYPAFSRDCFENNNRYFIIAQTEYDYSTSQEPKISTFTLTQENQIIAHKEYSGSLYRPGRSKILNDKKHYLIPANQNNVGPKMIVDTLPAISFVYPGDTNNDGVVDARDILLIGINFLSTGNVRESASLEWAEQYVYNWTTYPANYADCNGDGIVDEKDVIAIGVNWGKTHDTTFPKFSIDLSNQNKLLAHEEAFMTIYKSLESLEGEPAQQMKMMIEEIYDILLKEISLYPCYPNPFNPTTDIKFSLPQEMRVSLTIYNLKGQPVLPLIDNELLNAGYHTIAFHGNKYSSGIYFYVLKTPKLQYVHKMMLIK
jgi:hypothetical protein